MNPSCIFVFGCGFTVYFNDLIYYIDDNGTVEHGLMQ